MQEGQKYMSAFLLFGQKGPPKMAAKKTKEGTLSTFVVPKPWMCDKNSIPDYQYDNTLFFSVAAQGTTEKKKKSCAVSQLALTGCIPGCLIMMYIKNCVLLCMLYWPSNVQVKSILGICPQHFIEMNGLPSWTLGAWSKHLTEMQAAPCKALPGSAGVN